MRSPRLLPFSLTCLFTALISVLTLAQSEPSVARVNHPNALPETQSLPAGLASQLAQKQPVSFAKAVTYDLGALDSQSIAIADLNGDGKPDLVVASSCAFGNCPNDAAVVEVLLGNGDGTFQSAVTYSSGGFVATSVAIGDVNGDGRPDVVVSSECQTFQNCEDHDGFVSVLLGNGDGTLQTPVNYDSGGTDAISVSIADLNGDGHLDLVVTNRCCGKSVGVLLGKGNGTFQATVAYSVIGIYANSVAIGDLNGDGNPDLVVGVACQATCVNDGAVDVLLGNGDGTFQAAVIYGSGGSGTLSVAIGDVDGDGKPDLVMANSNDVVGVSLGNGDGTFQAPVSYPSGYTTASVAISDVNGDGKPDLLVANLHQKRHSLNGGVNVLLGNGDGTFQAPVSYSSGGASAYSVAVGDVNGDGKPDLLVSCSTVVGVLLNNFTATTATAVKSSLNPSLIHQAVTFTATITSNPPIPDGEVLTFYDGATAIATRPITNGVAIFSTSSLSAETQAIKASYPGDIYHKASSGTVSQVVTLYPSTTALTSSPNPSVERQEVALTATVSSGAPGGPTGKVTFKNGATTLGTATLSAGKATLIKTTLPIGTLTITATYDGDAQSEKSSGTITQTVN